MLCSDLGGAWGGERDGNQHFFAYSFGCYIVLNVFPLCSFKGSLTRDFRLQVFFMNQCPPGPQVFHWSHFAFFRKFPEIFENFFLSPVSTTPVINCSAVSTQAKNLLLVSLTPAINLCHGFSVIAGVVDTGEQFIAGDNDTCDNFIAGDNDIIE